MERYKYNSAGEKRSYFTSGTKQDMTQCQTRQGTALILKQTNKQGKFARQKLTIRITGQQENTGKSK